MRSILTPLLLCAATALLACGQSSPPPDDATAVAEAFWSAAQNRDQAGAMAFATTSENTQLDFENEESSIQGFTLGEPVAAGETTSIPTQLASQHGEQSMDMSFDTVLVQQNGEWLVELDQTSSNLIQSVLGVAMEDLTDAMADGMKEAMEGMGEAMAESMQEMTEGMAEAMQNSVDEVENGGK